VRVWPPEVGQDEAEDWQALRTITCPTLLVLGERGAVAHDQAKVDRMLADMRACRLVVIPGAGHNVHVEQPAAFLAAVQAFLSSAS
jgi:pimeloyl-ACP methyl ester carboxylesterase